MLAAVAGGASYWTAATDARNLFETFPSICTVSPTASWPDSFRPSTRLPTHGREWQREMPGTSPGMT